MSTTTRRAGEDRAIVELIRAFLQDQSKVLHRFEKRIDEVASDVVLIKDTQHALASDQKLLTAEMKAMVKAKEDQNGKLFKTIERVDEIEKRNANHDGGTSVAVGIVKYAIAALIGGGAVQVAVKFIHP